jgi:hypothetical protein
MRAAHAAPARSALSPSAAFTGNSLNRMALSDTLPDLARPMQ